MKVLIPEENVEGSAGSRGGTPSAVMSGHDGADDESKDKVAIPRHLSLLDCVWHLIGVIIGTGIYVSPTGVLRGSGGSVGLSFVLWVVCAIINVCGALTLAELSIIMKKSGGDFTFLLQAFGPLMAFIRLWSIVVIINPTGGAVGALVSAQYILTPFFQQCAEVPTTVVQLISICCFITVITVNCISAQLTSKLAGLLSVTKVLGLVLIIVTGMINLSRGQIQHFQNAFSSLSDYDVRLLPTGLLSGIWAYSGWSIITSVTEEIKNPARNIPLSIVMSMSLITVVYILTNIAYLTVLSPEEVLSSDAVAADYSVRALGANWAWLIWMVVAVSAFGSLNSGLFKSTRVIFASAREGKLPFIFSMVSITRRTPLPACLFVLIALLYLFETDVITLVGDLGFADAVFETFTVAIVPYYRWKHPNIPRPYKVPLVVALLYLATLLFIASMSLYADPLRKGIGLLIIFVAVPIYFALVHPAYRFKCLDPLSDRSVRFLQKLLLCIPQEKKTY